MRHITTILLLLLSLLSARAQQFYNLTADEVRVDSMLPEFSNTRSLPALWRDSVYSVSIAYPEYVDLPSTDIANYKRLSDGTLPPAEPELYTRVVFDRKRPSLLTTFCPIVFRGGRYQALASFMLRTEAHPRHAAMPSLAAADVNVWDTLPPAKRYATHSVLSSGRWVKIKVGATGYYQLTSSLVRQAGFSDLSKVKIYGYGGNLVNEKLEAKDLYEQDDLKEVPTCTIGGRRLFYARGPVSWESADAARRTRNYYADYGCYFLTEEGTAAPAQVDSATFVASYPTADDYHELYEVDGYSWYTGGRNFFDSKQVAAGSSMTVDIPANPNATRGVLSVNVTSSSYCRVQVEYNDSILGTLQTSNSNPAYIYGCQRTGNYNVKATGETAHVKLTVMEGSMPMRLDYVSMAWNNPKPLADLTSTTLPVPTYMYAITNQDHHADPQADMVIIIPTSQKLLKQAERLKAFHEQHDSLKVNIVPADELFNEFSSGTPDASAYRRYMKMLYDRATGDADRPKFLLLFGDCLWDNRMVTPQCAGKFSPDDYLLAYESEESFDKRSCYIDDGFHAMLDDGEGLKPMYQDKLDIGVGRFPVTTDAEAKVMVDKTIAYAENSNVGSWQNTVLFMGDDGDSNLHMTDANRVADEVIKAHPEYVVKKVMWDAYEMVAGATGNSYPDVTTTIKKQQQQGALVMDYAGHGAERLISHEKVLMISDFANFSNKNLPLWVTASCDIMPFDSPDETIGETAVLNDKGGAVAFYGTTRTVYATYNTTLNSAFMRHVLSYEDNGSPISLGEAVRRAKNDMSSSSVAANSLQYSLLGDPALQLHLPTAKIVIDSINGVDVSKSGTLATMKAGALVNVRGHVEGHTDFDGRVTLTVRDNLEKIVCRLNQPKEADDPFEYDDRTKTIFSGDDLVKAGRFSITFAVPKDINYSNKTGLINVFAVNDKKTLTAHGYNERFVVGGSDIAANDSVGPSIYCYLNSPTFTNGDRVNSTPYFVAQVTDRDGINSSGSGIGHDLQLVIDGKSEMTYSLNDNFQYDFGSYTSGSTYYNIPQLDPGQHRLQFRAWDILNNYSTAELTFRVEAGQKPSFSIACSDNPAKTSTTFIISHDRSGAELGVIIDVFDMSGRQLWRHEETGVSEGSTYTVNWDLTLDGGSRLQTGVYLYRVHLTSDGATKISKAKKLVVVGNK